jgi:hypothetical protein
MEKRETPIEEMAALATTLTDAMTLGQAAGLAILAAEMEALTHLMPGLAHPAATGPSEAEIEADFDNMPV